MWKNFPILCFFKLQPVSFYLYLNFFDLIYNNFNMSESMIQTSNKQFYLIQSWLVKIVNTMNRALLLLGVVTYFIFIWTFEYRTPLHKTYVVIRFIISCSRSVLYFFSFFFYITIVITENNYRENFRSLVYSFILFYLEINNIIWCF